MKHVFLLTGIIVVSLNADSTGERANPLKAEAGKELYAPIRKTIDFKEEKNIQQENGVIGGRGEPMHSYPPVSEQNVHKGH